jgi:metallophosphoesterase (TIGR00282 family)
LQDIVTVFAVGDVMGRAGRSCLKTFLPRIKQEFSPDIFIINGENIAGGFGITEKIFKEMTTDLGIDVVTTGNHWQDKPEIHNFHRRFPHLLLPANMYNVKELHDGFCVQVSRGKVPYAVINLTGRLFMKGDNRSPFECLDQILASLPVGVKVRIVDFHGEATSEKQAFAHYASGRVSLVYGTHTHCPTADERILGGKTGFATDVGMTGAYDSVIGVEKELSLASFLTPNKPRFKPAMDDPWLCALVARIDVASGHCLGIERIKWTLN